MPDSRKLLMITTGGTIVGQVATDKQDQAMVRNVEDLPLLLGPTVAYLNRRLDLDIQVDIHELAAVDSSNITPRHWADLAAVIKERYDDYKAFVVVHGTSTLGYTCAALSFALPNPAKPIIFTGSQVSAGLPGSDAITNLENAIRVAVWRRPDGVEAPPIRGVMAVFGSRIITGTRVKKDSEFDYDAFKSFSVGTIGRIGRIITIDDGNLRKHNSYHSSRLYVPALRSQDLICENDFDMRIASLTEFPGMSSGIFQSLIDQSDVQGFVLRSFSAGDPCEAHFGALRRLKQQRIPIVVTTQAPNGTSNFQVNDPGMRLRNEGLAIPAYDMSIEAITTKLGWLLAKRRNKQISYDQVCAEMTADKRGEIEVHWEFGA